MIELSQEIKDILHFKQGKREVTFRYDLLNYDEIKIGELTALDGSLGLNSLAQIKRRGRFNIKDTEINDVDWVNDRIRPVYILNGEHEFPLGVFMMASPVKRFAGDSIYRNIEAYDTSLIIREDKFDNRYRVIKGANYVTVIRQILNSAGIWKVNIPANAATLRTDREFEIGTSKLEVVNALLSEINYTSIWVDEAGYFRSSPYQVPNERQPEYIYKNDQMSVIIPDTLSEEADFFNVPNKWVVVASNPEAEALRSVYTNQNSASPASTVNRRRTIVDFRQVDDIAGQAALDDYVRRIAYEASNVYGRYVFSTALMPHHTYMDCIYCEHTRFGIKDKYIETNWGMDLSNGGTMTHSCRRVIQI